MVAMLSAVQVHSRPQQKELLYAAKGNICISSKTRSRNREFDIVIEINDGWHINSNQPLQKQLIATNLDVIDTTSANKKIDLMINTLKEKFRG